MRGGGGSTDLVQPVDNVDEREVVVLRVAELGHHFVNGLNAGLAAYPLERAVERPQLRLLLLEINLALHHLPHRLG